MAETTHTYRCEARDFVSDLVDFMKDQISRAVHDPNDQGAAMVAASGAVPVIRERLVPEHEALWATLVLLLVPYLDGTDGDALARLGKMSRDDFVTAGARLLERIDFAQSNVLAWSLPPLTSNARCDFRHNPQRRKSSGCLARDCTL